jgi:serine/threonine-protein kinase
MGSVWLANHLTLHVRCAVKFMSGDSQVRDDPSFRTRFEFEARAIAQLQSPHVVRILDYALVDDVPFIAMEYLQGEDLASRLSRVGRLDPATTYRIVSQVARGLAKAHLAKLVHRDIKPENIFLAREDDEQETVKLLDFGVAKSSAFVIEGTGTQAGALIGTPAYMSPEQVRGTREVDHRSDLWSLAVVAYQCLAGQLPFDSQALGEMFAQIMYEPIPVPSTVAPWLTPAFDTWWARAASRNAEDRFSSARELALTLGEALALPGVVSDVSGLGLWTQMPTPSAPPVAMTQPPVAGSANDSKPGYLTTTQSPLTRSLRGARQLMRSRSAMAVLAFAAVSGVIAVVATATVGRFGPPAAAGARAASPSPAASSIARAVEPDAASRGPRLEPTETGQTISVTDLPLAPPDSSAKPVSSEHAPARSPGPSRNGDRPAPKSPNDVDFGI